MAASFCISCSFISFLALHQILRPSKITPLFENVHTAGEAGAYRRQVLDS